MSRQKLEHLGHFDNFIFLDTENKQADVLKKLRIPLPVDPGPSPNHISREDMFHTHFDLENVHEGDSIHKLDFFCAQARPGLQTNVCKVSQINRFNFHVMKF